MKLSKPIEVELTKILVATKRLKSFDKFVSPGLEIEDADIKLLAIHDAEERNRLVIELLFLKKEVCQAINDLLKE